MKCRTRVRVVDYYPPDLRDFTQCLDHATYNDRSSQLTAPSSYEDDDAVSSAGRWEWAFYLLVEDPKPVPGLPKVQLPLLVHGQAAEHLLGMDAKECVHT